MVGQEIQGIETTQKQGKTTAGNDAKPMGKSHCWERRWERWAIDWS